MPYIISANRLMDGLIVFRSVDGQWRESAASAEILRDKPSLDAGLAAALADIKACLVLEVAAIEMIEDNGQWRAAHIRDSIRIKGPSIDAGPARHAPQPSSTRHEPPDVSI
ncbi:MAG: DUF2849 domain-containing protein [Beijerinckiaceae bacterium]|jgi:hypothetical protein|nr:DUF2849 domain-containing protein [Beijerinckiaceae bacterium]